MKNLRQSPQRLGAERRETECSILAEIVHKCPECGSSAYYPEAGCHVCRSCGYSPCK